jgi:hypothetical protein
VGGSMTLVFKQSLTSAAKQIGCAANQALQITSAEMGAGTSIQVGIKSQQCPEQMRIALSVAYC